MTQQHSALPSAISGASSFYIPSLDGIRAVAILIVFLSHAGLDRLIPGGLGVTIFFFLSGYLITTLLRREVEKTGTLSLRRFYMRRMLRIWPTFYIVLVAGALLTICGLLPGVIRPLPFLAQALHWANYQDMYFGNYGTTAGSSVLWSLAVEEHYYLIFPFIYLGLVKKGASRSTQALVFSALCVLLLVWRWYLVVYQGQSEGRIYHATDTRVDSIFFGSILAVFGNPVIDEWKGSDRLWKWGLLPLGIAGLLASLAFRDPVFRSSLRYTLQGISLFPIFITAIRYPDWLPFRFLNLGPVRLLGWISYPLYLVHFTVIEVFADYSGLPAGVREGLALAVALLVAYAIFRFVDQPVARLRKKHSMVA